MVITGNSASIMNWKQEGMVITGNSASIMNWKQEVWWLLVIVP